MPDDPDHEILLEMHQIGAALEVRAVSGADGLEVSFAVPAHTTNSDIERLARSKLAYVRRRRDGQEGGKDKAGDGRGGIVA